MLWKGKADDKTGALSFGTRREENHATEGEREEHHAGIEPDPLLEGVGEANEKPVTPVSHEE